MGAHAAAGSYFDYRVDSPAWWKTLAHPAPPYLFKRRSWRNSLYLVGKGRSPTAAHLWRYTRHPARFSSDCMGGAPPSATPFCRGPAANRHLNVPLSKIFFRTVVPERKTDLSNVTKSVVSGSSWAEPASYLTTDLHVAPRIWSWWWRCIRGI